jgi:hypothetical protein
MSRLHPDQGGPILLEFPIRPGVEQVSLDPAQILEKSAMAVDSVMTTINSMARRVIATVNDVAEPPAEVSVEFSIKVDAEAGAIIAKAGSEASFQVRLTWRR